MTDPKRRWWQFRISTILLWMVIVALAVGWWLERERNRRAAVTIDMLRQTIQDQQALVTSVESGPTSALTCKGRYLI